MEASGAERRDLQVELLERQAGAAMGGFREDGYVNMMTKYGTDRDSSEGYRFEQDQPVPDEELSACYEQDGLFAKVIDAPAEEALRNGFELDGISDDDLVGWIMEELDGLEWTETAMTAIKWARLFGGSIIVMIADDGGGLEEPLNLKKVRSVDELRVFDRSIVQPDVLSAYGARQNGAWASGRRKPGEPEFYDVFSRYGTFRVHESRCLVFRNSILPEKASNTVYQEWGIPEYVRIRRALRDAEVAHGTATKLLDRSVQAVYKMKDLAAEMATEEGENRVLRRLRAIDLSRSLLNSIAIDGDGEDYDFRTFQFTGVPDVIDATCNLLSAITNIPQTILFGRSPAGLDSTGESDLENWYNYVERIQARMLRGNLRRLLTAIACAGRHEGKIDEIPKIKVKFNPLWSLSELEQAQLDQARAAAQQTRANTAAAYVNMQALDPTEVRRKLADSGEFDVETILDDLTDEDLEDVPPAKGGQDSSASAAAPGSAEGGQAAEGRKAEGAEGEEEPRAEKAEEPKAGGIRESQTEERGEKPGPEKNGGEAAQAEPDDGGDGAGNSKRESNSDGGPGSGNWGHAGRPGKVGGSAPGGGRSKRVTTIGPSGEKAYSSFAKERDRLARPHDVSISEFCSLPRGTVLKGDFSNVGIKDKSITKLDRNRYVGESGEEYDHFNVLRSRGGKRVILSEDARWRYETPPRKGPVEGGDITGSCEKGITISEILHKQGFDSLPKMAGREEFDEAVRESGVTAARGYCADSKEVLDSYRDALYNGQFFVECEGGAAYGKGMYSAANFDGRLSQDAMDTAVGYTKGDNVGYVERFSMQKGSRIADYKTINRWYYGNPDMDMESYVNEKALKGESSFKERHGEAAARLYGDFMGYKTDLGAYAAVKRSIGQERLNELLDEMNGIRSGIKKDFDKAYEAERKKIEKYQETFDDEGSLAAALGYDAIRVERGESDYLVVLNRSKCIFLDQSADGGRSDSADGGGQIWFRPAGNGGQEAVRDGKVIGHVWTMEDGVAKGGGSHADAAGNADGIAISESGKPKRSDGGPGSGFHGHAGRPGHRGGSAGRNSPSGAAAGALGSKAGGGSQARVRNERYMGLIPADSYTKDEKYKEAASRMREAADREGALREKARALGEELKGESRPKPRDEWTDEDLFDHFCGRKPTIYTDRGRQLKKESDDVEREMGEAAKSAMRAGDEMMAMKREAHDRQAGEWKRTRPRKAESEEFEGFDTSSTGTPASDQKLEDGRGYIASMPPEEYIKRCAYEIFDRATVESVIGGTSKETVGKYTDMMAAGAKFDMPYLDYSRGGQEGRHRALAAYNLGIKEIPVFVTGYYGSDGREDGGQGSGNWGHAGRPGIVGGSAAGGGKPYRLPTPDGGYTSMAQAKKENAEREKRHGKEPEASGTGKTAWKDTVSQMRADTLAKEENEQAIDMIDCGYLDYDTALEMFKGGTISTAVNKYYDILESNGDLTPTKTTTDKQKSINTIAQEEYGGNYTAARKGEIKKETGASDEEAERYFEAVQKYTASNKLTNDKSALEEYISKAPAYSGEISRGMRFMPGNDNGDYDKFMEQVRSGVVRMEGVSSWTSNNEVARRFAHIADEDWSSIVVTCVANKTSVPIEHITSVGGEDEVLASGFASWSVLNVTETETSHGAKKAYVTVIERGEQNGE